MTALVLTGLGRVTPSPDDSPFDPTPVLRQRKLRKFMALQDDLAVGAVHRALTAARLDGRPLGDRSGLFLAVGYTAFDEQDLTPLLDASGEGEGDQAQFSMRRFATAGLESINPLMTFRVLPNMPAFHVSLNFELTGRYFVTYPGPGQLYVALQQAAWALEDGAIDVAVVAGVAAQRNFLVRHLLGRLEPPAPTDQLRDAAGVMILERESSATERGAAVRGRLLGLDVAYQPTDPCRAGPPPEESLDSTVAGRVTADGDLGAASLPVLLDLASAAGAGEVTHRLRARDGITAASRWELMT